MEKDHDLQCQTRPPLLRAVDDASRDDWTFTVNAQLHHSYPDIKGYRRDSNNITPGDAEPWKVYCIVKKHGRAVLDIDWPPRASRFDGGQRDGIWACSSAKVWGFRVHATIMHQECQFVTSKGMAPFLSAEVRCEDPRDHVRFEISCAGLSEHSLIPVVFERLVIWHQFDAGMPDSTRKGDWAASVEGNQIREYQKIKGFVPQVVTRPNHLLDEVLSEGRAIFSNH